MWCVAFHLTGLEPRWLSRITIVFTAYQGIILITDFISKDFFRVDRFFSVHFMDKNGRSTIGNCLCTIRKALCCIKSINKEIKTVFLFYALSFAFNNCLTSDHTIIRATKWNRILLPFGIVTYMNFKCIFLLIPKMLPITAINGDRLVYENICTNRYDKLNFNSSFLWRVVSAYNCVLIFINFSLFLSLL